MTENSGKRYDDTEARSLLVDYAADQQKRTRLRDQDAKALLEELAALEGFLGFRAHFSDPWELDVAIGSARARVIYTQEAGFMVYGRGGARTEIALRFNPLEQRYEAGEDTFFLPEPGKPRRRRSALAALVEGVLAQLG